MLLSKWSRRMAGVLFVAALSVPAFGQGLRGQLFTVVETPRPHSVCSRCCDP